jgi:ADP-dependent NAD(P)H-hydrate dehydratase
MPWPPTRSPTCPPNPAAPVADPGGPGRGVVATVTPMLLRGWPLPAPGEDKETKGRLLVVGGSDRTPGAVRLAAEAAFRVGAGKVQVATTSTVAPLLAVAVPEALVVGLPDEDGELSVAGADQVLDLASDADAVLVGPGVGTADAGCRLLESLVPGLRAPLVVDALGTAFVTTHRRGLEHLASRALLTPNVTELAEILGSDVEEIHTDVLGAAVRVVSATGVAVLAGAETSYVVDPAGRSWAVGAGGSGAAVAGSGDVKAGAVAGLVARGASPAQAAAWGAYLHARAGARLTVSVGRVGFLAREIGTELAAVLGEVDT